ncbi:hypothetical protein FB008_12087 [Sinorhizobium medicae]|nr:hypothetical protein FB008_12087 [Sinorhizobium medicae]
MLADKIGSENVGRREAERQAKLATFCQTQLCIR